VGCFFATTTSESAPSRPLGRDFDLHRQTLCQESDDDGVIVDLSCLKAKTVDNLGVCVTVTIPGRLVQADPLVPNSKTYNILDQKLIFLLSVATVHSTNPALPSWHMDSVEKLILKEDTTDRVIQHLDRARMVIVHEG
jgi:hypothetical protein